MAQSCVNSGPGAHTRHHVRAESSHGLKLFFIALGLAIDAFAVTLGAGAVRLPGGLGSAARLAFDVGQFQFMMPVIGWVQQR